jgi:hypothetical protein
MSRYPDKDETVIVNVHCHAETPKAMLLSTDGEEDNAEWTPKSQMLHIGVKRGEDGDVELKEWIAKQNGFI